MGDPPEATSTQPMSCLPSKSIEQRKGLLKQYGICYRWVASSNLMGKDCKSPIKCIECHSDKHISALHAGVPPRTGNEKTPVDPKPQDDTRGRGEEVGKVTTICTEFVVSNLEESLVLRHVWLTFMLKDNPKLRQKFILLFIIKLIKVTLPCLINLI